MRSQGVGQSLNDPSGRLPFDRKEKTDLGAGARRVGDGGVGGTCDAGQRAERLGRSHLGDGQKERNGVEKAKKERNAKVPYLSVVQDESRRGQEAEEGLDQKRGPAHDFISDPHTERMQPSF